MRQKQHGSRISSEPERTMTQRSIPHRRSTKTVPTLLTATLRVSSPKENKMRLKPSKLLAAAKVMPPSVKATLQTLKPSPSLPGPTALERPEPNLPPNLLRTPADKPVGVVT